MITLKTPPFIEIEKPGGEKARIFMYGPIASEFLREFRKAMGAGDKSFGDFLKLFEEGAFQEPDPIDCCAAVKVLLPADLLDDNGKPALGLPECRALFIEAAKIVLDSLTDSGGLAEKK